MTYNLKDTVVISNSDGGSGYEKDQFENIIGRCERHEHFRDRYHVNRKIKERLRFDKLMAEKLIKAVHKYDYNQINVILETTIARIDDSTMYEDYSNEVSKLRAYINRNWLSIKPLFQRDIPIERGIGVCESNHRPFS